MLEQGWGKIGLWAAAPDQYGALPFQPLLFGQAGGDGVDLGRFADDQQEAGFAAPERAVVGAHMLVYPTLDRLTVSCPRANNGEFVLHTRKKLKLRQFPHTQYAETVEQHNNQTRPE
ncbi:hypothetical protein D3C76_618920 [compost metagenome]